MGIGNRLHFLVLVIFGFFASSNLSYSRGCWQDILRVPLQADWWHDGGEARVGEALAEKFGLSPATPMREADELHWRAYLAKRRDYGPEHITQVVLPLSQLFTSGVAMVRVPGIGDLLTESRNRVFGKYFEKILEAEFPGTAPDVYWFGLRQEPAPAWGYGVHVDQFIYQPEAKWNGGIPAYYPAIGSTIRMTTIYPSELYGQTVAVPYGGPYEGKLVQAPPGYFLVFLGERVIHSAYASPEVEGHPRTLWTASARIYNNPVKP